MKKGIVGKKIGMTQIFTGYRYSGRSLPGRSEEDHGKRWL